MRPTRKDVYTFLLPLVLYVALLADGVNLFDFFAYEDYIKTSAGFDPANAVRDAFGVWGGGQGGLSRSSLYVLFSYPFAYFLKLMGFDVGFLLNLFSAILTSLSVVFVRRSLMLLFNEKLSNASTLVYTLTPWIFFNGINATLSSMQLAITSVWLYYIILYRLTAKTRYAYMSSVLLTANVFSHLISLPLILPHLYALFKRNKKPGFILKNAVLLAPAGVVAGYFLFLNKAYSVGLSPAKFVFSLGLVLWEFVNALSLPVFVLSILSVLLFLKARNSVVHDLFLLSVLSAIPTLLIFHYVPVANFNPIFIFVPLLTAHALKTIKGGKIALLIIVLVVFKAVPMVYDFHSFPHPHAEYAAWLNSVVGKDDYVLVGHECAAARAYLPDRAVCENEEETIRPGKRILVTSQYVENENQMELRHAASSLGIKISGLGLGKPAFIDGKNLTLFQEFTGNVRPVEDHYQWLYSVYPSLLRNAFLYGALPTPAYSIYILEDYQLQKV